jgi:hypothetical protein
MLISCIEVNSFAFCLFASKKVIKMDSIPNFPSNNFKSIEVL